MTARAWLQALRSSHRPADLAGRQSERTAIRAFLRAHVLESGGGGSLYICGTPGSGKTLMVSEAVRALHDETRGARRFALVELNGMSLSSVPSVFGHVRTAPTLRCIHRPDLAEGRALLHTRSTHCTHRGCSPSCRVRRMRGLMPAACVRQPSALRLQIFDALPASLQKKAVGYGAEQWLRSALQPGGVCRLLAPEGAVHAACVVAVIACAAQHIGKGGSARLIALLRVARQRPSRRGWFSSSLTSSTNSSSERRKTGRCAPEPPSPGADVAGASAVPVQMWQG